MNARHQLLVLTIAICIIHACKKQTELTLSNQTKIDETISAPPNGNYWQFQTYFPAPYSRSGAGCFVINGKAYIFGGEDPYGNYHKDLWEYDPGPGGWTQKASLPVTALARKDVATFVLNNKGYIVGGRQSSQYNETWEYDPVNNIWTKRKDLSLPLSNATGFSINGKGYVAMGFRTADHYINDVLEYDPVTDNWVFKSSLTNPYIDLGRNSCVSFVINNKVYIGMGNTVYGKTNDFWEFNPSSNTWIKKADYPDVPASYAVAVTTGAIGYVGTGHVTGQAIASSSFWSYNPSTNTWSQRADVPGGPRAEAICFYVANRVHIGLGFDFYNDIQEKIYRFIPYSGIVNPFVN